MRISCWSFIFLKALLVVFGSVSIQGEMVSAQDPAPGNPQEFQVQLDVLSQDLSEAILYEDSALLRGSWSEAEQLLQQHPKLRKREASQIFDLLCYAATQNYELTKLAKLDGTKVVTYCENDLVFTETDLGYHPSSIQVATSYRLIDEHKTGIRKLKKARSKFRNKARLRRLGNIYNDPFNKGRRLFFTKEISEIEFALADLYSEIDQHQKAVDLYRSGFDQVIYDAVSSAQQVAKYSGINSQIELDRIADQVTSGMLMPKERIQFGYSLFKVGNFAESEKEFLKALSNLEARIETWEFRVPKARELASGTEPIPLGGSSLIDNHQELYKHLQELMFIQGRYENALEFSERGRTLGLNSLVNTSNDPLEVSRIKETQYEDIRKVADQEGVTFIEYSVIDNDTAYVYAIVPGKELFSTTIELADFFDASSTRKHIYIFSIVGSICIFSALFLYRKSAKFSMLWLCMFVPLTISCGIIPKWSLKTSCLQKDSESTFQTYTQDVSDAIKGTTHSEKSENGKVTVHDCLQEQYRILIQPVEHLLPKNPQSPVVFVPNEDLHRVSFSALKNASGQYLIENHTILVAPSIQFLAALDSAERVNISEKNALVVGNPSLPSLFQNLSSLPDASKEASEVSKILGVSPLLGSEATESRFIRESAKAQVIHLATHGDPEKKIPGPKQEQSQNPIYDKKKQFLLERGLGVLALAPSNQADGLLTEIELYDLQFNAELVVLSACDTGLGKISSDGVIGLARPFLASGVPAVVASLWRVPDSPTAELMTNFYQSQYFSSNRPQALREAMIKTMRLYPDDPKMWASFIFVGLPNYSKPEEVSTARTTSQDSTVDTLPGNQLSQEQLDNMEYSIDPAQPYKRSIKLKDGKYKENYVDYEINPNGYQIYNNFSLGDVARGDLDGDGDDDAMVTLTHSGRGSGIFTYLAAVINEDGTPINVDSVMIGDEVGVGRLEILEDGEIAVRYGQGKPKRISRETYILENQKLNLK